ncbi:PREDICTED: ankyrin repeat-containing protein NPR4-like isoform X1 [Nicotiana attenuata]|uniref:ankyrin repeat-containing protein NPR4-like isoform X1 n=1 Tax=Nicotiana attenuata TaxID=49451 RepID=UPI000905CA75|nr:PREDICTED: ankyrin repeat-containing protein NPR4-like isoform X1 [Nicotiana attenuata]
MENIRKLQLERTLSIPTCFPQRNSVPSTTATSEGVSLRNSSFNTSSSTPQHAVAIQLNQGIGQADSTVLPSPIQREAVSRPIAPAPQTLPTSFLRPRTKPINLTMYVPLCQAALGGDWEKAREFFSLHPGATSARITKGWETALHIAAGANKVQFVEELVKLMSPLELALQNKYDNTALCFAAASGLTRIAKVMVMKNQFLPIVRGSKGVTPLHMAALLGHGEMVWYLYSVTDHQYLCKDDYISLLIATINSNLFDVALHILQHMPELGIERDQNGDTILHVLARKPLAFSDKIGLGIWQKFLYAYISVHLQNRSSNMSSGSRIKNNTKVAAYAFITRVVQHLLKTIGVKEVLETKLMHLQALELVKCSWKEVLLLNDSQIGNLLRSPSRPLFVAAELGNFKFIVELIQSYPDLIWKVDEESRSIFHIAVIHRQEKIYKLIYNIGAHKDIITSYKSRNNENILHLAAKLAPTNRLGIVSGAALQMQRELLWFKEVKTIVQASYKEMRDSKGQTHGMLFAEEHKELVKEGEKWMKETASSCMLVAALITTVIFAAIFTVPGGNNDDTGTPIFLREKTFILFSITDALALFSSVTSILMFLSILTSRYAEEDFLSTLPKRLILGFITLFVAIAAMLVAFSSSFFIVLGHQMAWIIIPVAVLASIPITLFAFLQFPLLADMIRSTYGSGIFTFTSKDTIY